VSKKRRRTSLSDEVALVMPLQQDGDEDSTEIRLACLASLHPDISQDALLDALLACQGHVKSASQHLSGIASQPLKKSAKTVGYQSSLTNLIKSDGTRFQADSSKSLTRKGKTLFLYSPQDVEANTPCSIIHNFLPAAEADSLLMELLEESKTFGRETFNLFDRTVESPHTMSFFVNSMQEIQDQKTSYVYNGSRIKDVRQSPPETLKVSPKVASAVNAEIQRRIKAFYPNGEKLKYQSLGPWKPNTAFVNCYDGPQESVGYHSDQLTYLGPRAVIGSISLGVAREFRVRRIVPQSAASDPKDTSGADSQGQISIHLPHNSLLVMHAEMQEQWKHSVAPANAIDPHPLAGNKRINITYRYYKDAFHPRFTPRCHCGIATVLRCVQRKVENLGRYMWMCHAGYTPGQKGCSFFKWADFDEDGEPPWKQAVADTKVEEPTKIKADENP